MMMVVMVETRLDDVRRRPDLTRGCPRVGAGRRLGRENLWREGLVVGDPVAVPKPVLEQIFPKKIQIRIFWIRRKRF